MININLSDDLSLEDLDHEDDIVMAKAADPHSRDKTLSASKKRNKSKQNDTRGNNGTIDISS